MNHIETNTTANSKSAEWKQLVEGDKGFFADCKTCDMETDEQGCCQGCGAYYDDEYGDYDPDDE